MFKSIILKDKEIKPALFLAPMAGITNSAFRRLLAEFGGYGALYTEMISGKGVLYENILESSYTKRREGEGSVIYQLLLNANDKIEEIIEKISMISPFGLDLNLGCPAPSVRRFNAGSALFADIKNMELVVKNIRKYWDGIFTVKVRLGEDPNNWKDGFFERIKIFEEYGVDAITVHPRFVQDRLRRRVRWEELAEIKDRCQLPVFGNGDIVSPDQINENISLLDGLMLGRVVVAKPWIFKVFSEGFDENEICYSKVWEKYYNYVLEDFPANKAIGRIKEFNSYFAKNFFFGHKLYSVVQGSKDLNFIYDQAMMFLKNSPQITKNISLAGI